MFPSWFVLLVGSFVFLDMGPSILFLVFPLLFGCFGLFMIRQGFIIPGLLSPDLKSLFLSSLESRNMREWRPDLVKDSHPFPNGFGWVVISPWMVKTMFTQEVFHEELCMRMDGINEHWCNLHLLTVVLAKRVNVMFKNIGIKLLLSCV